MPHALQLVLWRIFLAKISPRPTIFHGETCLSHVQFIHGLWNRPIRWCFIFCKSRCIYKNRNIIYICVYTCMSYDYDIYIYLFIYLFVYYLFIYLFIYLCVWVCVLWLCYIYNISVKYPETLPGIKRSNRQWPTDSLGSWQSVTPQKPLVREIPRVPITPKTIQTFWGIQLVFQIQPHNFSLNFDGKSIPNPSQTHPTSSRNPTLGQGAARFSGSASRSWSTFAFSFATITSSTWSTPGAAGSTLR